MQSNNHSVVQEPPGRGISSPGVTDSVILNFATVADELPIWGRQPALRDRYLRAFWPTEPYLCSAMFTTCARYAAFGWTLVGPPRTVEIYHRILHASEHGDGWIALQLKVLQDLFGTDNGAFMEVERIEDSPTSPVIRLNHLDSGRCARTGLRDTPVVYTDIRGVPHLLRWYEVITLTEFPSSIETMYGMQYCVVTRLLRAAQILRDISIYKREKISGRFNRAVHIVGGIARNAITDALAVQADNADNAGLIRYVTPLVIAGLDPNSRISKETIEFATLPDGFDEEVTMKWYLEMFALAFAGEYQDFGPLPGGNLGTAQQSQVLHLKSRGKGPALYMGMLAHKLNFHGVLPSTVTFKFGEMDIAEQAALADIRQKRAQTRALRIQSGEITPEIARQEAQDDGDLKPEYMAMLGESNTSPDVIRGSSTRSAT